MSEPCERKNKWVGPCRFEARYSISEPIFPAGGVSGWGVNPEDFRRKTYEGDVCTRCGRFVAPPVLNERVGDDE